MHFEKLQKCINIRLVGKVHSLASFFIIFCIWSIIITCHYLSLLFPFIRLFPCEILFARQKAPKLPSPTKMLNRMNKPFNPGLSKIFWRKKIIQNISRADMSTTVPPGTKLRKLKAPRQVTTRWNKAAIISLHFFSKISTSEYLVNETI